MQADIEKAFGATGESPLLRKPLAEAAPITSFLNMPSDPAPEPARAQPANRPDRRQSDRRSMDKMREEALRNVISRVEDRNTGYRPRRGLRSGMAARIALLFVALIAGGVAAFLATQNNAPVQPVAEPKTEVVTQVIKEARTQILVAKESIGVGEQLSPASVEWVEWPEGAVRSDFITTASVTEATAAMSGAIARYEFFAGEPIRAAKLAEAGAGYMSTVLEAGMRGVSVSVDAESASGGFIFPNDHVDVVLTAETDFGQVSETILHNVRVLAINNRLSKEGEPEAVEGADEAQVGMFAKDAIAVLALDPVQAEVIMGARARGDLALVLRSVADFGESDRIEDGAANATIRMTSPFWQTTTSNATLN